MTIFKIDFGHAKLYTEYVVLMVKLRMKFDWEWKDDGKLDKTERENGKKKLERRYNFIYCHVMAHGDEEVGMILSPRWTKII